MIERVASDIASRRGAMLELLRELVEINSFTEHREGGEAVAAVLARELRAIPELAVDEVESARYARHLVVSTRAAAATVEGAVALIGHHDTVFPPGTFEGFRVEGDVARGPGVLDMKGGLVIQIETLRALSRAGVLADLPVRLVVVSDEEIGSPEGAPILSRAVRGAACALVFEAGRAADAIITARKGTGSVHAVATGRAAHAGNAHERGANAIWALSRFIDRAQSLTDYTTGVTISAGRVAGGHSKNTVPDHAEAWLDLRYVHALDGEELVAALEACARDASAGVPGTSIALVGGLARPPLERTDANVALCREYAACARAAGLGDGEAPLMGGGSDASTSAALGVPSIDGLGPRGTGFHTKDERIEIATLAPKAEALARFLLGRRGRG
jgi:glutamate carboxypeptidase